MVNLDFEVVWIRLALRLFLVHGVGVFILSCFRFLSRLKASCRRWPNERCRLGLSWRSKSSDPFGVTFVCRSLSLAYIQSYNIMLLNAFEATISSILSDISNILLVCPPLCYYIREVGNWHTRFMTVSHVSYMTPLTKRV